jgi:transposase
VRSPILTTNAGLFEWCDGAEAEYGDAATPVGLLLARFQQVHRDACADLIVSWNGEHLVVNLFNQDFPLAIDANGPRLSDDLVASSLEAFGIESIAPGLWALTPSLLLPEVLHVFVAVYDVPSPAPWERSHRRSRAMRPPVPPSLPPGRESTLTRATRLVRRLLAEWDLPWDLPITLTTHLVDDLGLDWRHYNLLAPALEREFGGELTLEYIGACEGHRPLRGRESGLMPFAKRHTEAEVAAVLEEYGRSQSVRLAAEAVGVSPFWAYSCLVKADAITAHTPVYTSRLVKEALALYVAGNSCRAVAAELRIRHGSGPSHEWVRVRAAEHGLLRNHRAAEHQRQSRERGRNYESLRDTATVLYVRQKWSLHAVAKLVGANRSTVKRWLLTAGVPVVSDLSRAMRRYYWESPAAARRTETRARAIDAYIREGSTYRAISKNLGVSISTVYLHLRREKLVCRRRRMADSLTGLRRFASRRAA